MAVLHPTMAVGLGLVLRSCILRFLFSFRLTLLYNIYYYYKIQNIWCMISHIRTFKYNKIHTN